MNVRNRHALYRAAAQNPEADLAFIDRMFSEHTGTRANTLREDFCDSAYLSYHFVTSDNGRRAIAVDPKPDGLEFCREHDLGGDQAPLAQRLQLVQAPVLEGPPDKTDVVCAMNFGLFLLPTRDELRRYFELTRKRLADPGLFIAELVGGEESIKPLLESREEEGFTYVWEQESFNPIHSTMKAHVHFELPDGGQLYRAFSYDWRVWTVVELREVLAEAGFSRSWVYWEQTDDTGFGTGEYAQTEEEEQQESWLAYLVAVP